MMSSLRDQLEDRLAELRRQRAKIEREIQTYQESLPLLIARIEELELLEIDSDTEEVQPQEPQTQELVPTNGHPQKPTEAVLGFLRIKKIARPGDIVNALIGQISTDSTNPRRTLHNTIYNMVQSGRLEKTSTGRVRLPREAD